MGYETTADRHISEARKHLQASIESLIPVVFQGCEGIDDFKPEYVSELTNTLFELRKLYLTL